MAGEAQPNIRTQSPYMQAVLGPESPAANANPAYRPYAHLLHGELNEALAAKAESPATHARIMRLVAASDGASPQMIHDALALPADQGLDADTYLVTLALLEREHADIKPYVPLAGPIYKRDAVRVMSAYMALRAHADRSLITQAMGKLDPRSRGYVYAAACVLDGATCPHEWRVGARQLLFAYERPFLK
jgi:hypothetical protein